ncbi:prepilin peptidase [Tateyamaria sp. ANG-S1]|uniref:prepilin peptidase n=1 Tax=Tateyamaria sp. ANG-S1 TaxID=1577905 RepID=UPI00057C3893|nr:prepilin peptidase [Tateyamaria sp. ANG-S1]KIC51179.1 membrane protein [Tateyamaria sp. ANG-S1]
MALSASVALWFLPLLVPLCLYVAYTDLSEMRITNPTVITMAAIFAAMGPFLYPLDTYLWQLAHLGIVLLAGMVLNAAGAMGAGDAKFLAAAAPYVALGDIRLVMALFAAVLLAAYAVHTIAKRTSLRNYAPNWTSWSPKGRRFPMGFALGPTLAIYLILAAMYGS